MKIFIPSNIVGGFLNYGFDIGPFKLEIWQLIVLVLGLGIVTVIASGMNERGVDLLVIFLLVMPIVLITFLIAFFNLSELRFLPFIIKMIQSYFIDSPKKFFINYSKINPYNVIHVDLKTAEGAVLPSTKKNTLTSDDYKKLQGYV